MATEPNGNGNGVYAGMPWWVKAFGIVGAPVLLSMALLYMYNGVLADTKSAIEADVIESRGILTAVRDHQDATLKLEKLLEKICRRVSKSEAEKDQC